MTKRKQSQNEHEVIFFLLLIVLALPLAAWYGFVVAKVWGWFAVPLGAPRIGVWTAAGLYTLARLLTFDSSIHREDEKKSAAEKFGAAVSLGLFVPGVLSWLRCHLSRISDMSELSQTGQSDSPQNVQAVAAIAASKCALCPREILLLEKAFMGDDYAMFCARCMANSYNDLRQRTAMQGFGRTMVPAHIAEIASDHRYSDKYLGNALRVALGDGNA